jgi:hypothetical protein
MAYTPQKMEAARKRTESARKALGDTVRVGKTGRMTMQVDQEAYFNAIDRNGGVDESGKTVWSDTEYRRDMMKRHPEIVVEAEKAGNTIGPFTGPAAGNFNRIFGEGRFDGVVSVPGDPFAHIKIR